MEIRRCYHCGETKVLDLFPRHKGMPKGRGYQCKRCCRLKTKRYRKDHPERVAETERKRHRIGDLGNSDRCLLYKVGLPMGGYDILFSKQGGRCAICGTETPGGRWNARFHVDHCAETGKVRGLLCNNCNRGLGFFNDHPERLLSAAKYLASFR